MPVIKTERSDIMRAEEVNKMLERAEAGSVKYGKQTFRFHPEMVKCLIALLTLFGKRITENLKLKRGDFELRGWRRDKKGSGFLRVTFPVLKKKRKIRITKEITLKHPLVIHILKWLGKFQYNSQYVFPGHVRERTITVKQKLKTGEKTYVYKRPAEPRMSRELAYKILKGLNDGSYPHLFRSSLATEMAEREATEDQLMAWFDWDSAMVAHGYVKRGPRLTRRFSKRTW